ncbi:hypothetical protein ACLOJK_004767 [Asimina triloba]
MGGWTMLAEALGVWPLGPAWIDRGRRIVDCDGRQDGSCWIRRTLVMEAVWSSGLRALLDHDAGGQMLDEGARGHAGREGR